MVVTVRKFVQRHVLHCSKTDEPKVESTISEEHSGIEIVSVAYLNINCVITTSIFYIPQIEKTMDVLLTKRQIDENNQVVQANQNFYSKRTQFHIINVLDTENFRNKTVTVTLEFEWQVRGEFPAMEHEKTWDFGKFDRNLTNVTLAVEEKKFHVNKVILATHSSYFHTLFFGPNSIEFAPESEIKLKNISAETLQSLLEILYHTPNVHIDNAEDVLEAGRMYSIPLVSDHCKQVIVEDGGRVPRDERRRLAEEFGINWGEMKEEI